MKSKAWLLVALIFLAGCSLIWGPAATVKTFMEAAQKGDLDKMTELYSKDAVQKIGLDKIRSNNQSFAGMVQEAATPGKSYRMVDVQETPMPLQGRRVSFLYQDDSGTDSRKLVFDLSREGTAWKIEYVSGDGMPPSTILAAPTPIEPTLPPGPPSVPSSSEKGEADTKSGTKSKTISGGVLNGKAISLPQPPYPPVAKAAKASGNVVVQVLVDEEGNVESARAVSGHPLLQGASVLAARSAKFSPTKLSGVPVKVSGLVVYKFEAQ